MVALYLEDLIAQAVDKRVQLQGGHKARAVRVGGGLPPESPHRDEEPNRSGARCFGY